MIEYNSLYPADGAYGKEKMVGEAMLDAYIEAGHFAGCSTRSFTVYGPLMKENHAIAALIAKTLLHQDPFEIWGDGNQTRSFLYVDECVEAVLRLMRSEFTGPVNIGSEEMVTINQLASMAIELSGKNITIKKKHAKKTFVELDNNIEKICNEISIIARGQPRNP